MTRQTITVREVSSIYDNSIQTILYSCALNKDYNSNSDIKLSLTSLSLNNKYLELGSIIVLPFVIPVFCYGTCIKLVLYYALGIGLYDRWWR